VCTAGVQQCVFVLCQSLPLSIPKSTFHHSHHHEVAGYTTAPREVFSLPSSLPSGDMSTSFVAWPATRKVILLFLSATSIMFGKSCNPPWKAMSSSPLLGVPIPRTWTGHQLRLSHCHVTNGQPHKRQSWYDNVTQCL